MRNIKRAISVLMAAVMVMTMLAGCGGSDSSLEAQLRAMLNAETSEKAEKVATELGSLDTITDAWVFEPAVAEYGTVKAYIPYLSGKHIIMLTYDGETQVDRIEVIKYEDVTVEDIIARVRDNINIAVVQKEMKDMGYTVNVYLAVQQTDVDSYIIVCDLSISGDGITDFLMESAENRTLLTSGIVI